MKAMRKIRKIIFSAALGAIFLMPILSRAEQLENPLGSTESIPALIGKVIYAVMGLVGSISLAMFVYGGIVWLTSGGSPDKVKKGKDVLVWAVIGLAIIFSSYAITNFIFTQVVPK